jgi:hypothetical protein
MCLKSGAKMPASRSARPSKVLPVEKSLTGIAAIRAFLERELPSTKSGDTAYLTDALVAAGERYDRYAANKQSWWLFAHRRRRLEQVARRARELATALHDLDILSRDDLSSRFGPKEMEALLGSTLLLSKEASNLAGKVQKSGAPRDLAEERWILELADIYENAFSTPARFWGSGSDKAKYRGKFYDFLMVSRPRSFLRHGKLSQRQVHRTLEQRVAHRNKSLADLFARR